MRIIYLSPYDILRPRTNQLADVRFAEGFAQNGCETHLIVPFVKRGDNIETGDIKRIYGLRIEPKIHFLPSVFKSDIKGKADLLRIAWESRKVLNKISKEQPKNTLLISRSYALLLLLLLLRKAGFLQFKNLKIAFWAHDFKADRWYAYTCRKVDHLLATNSSIADSIQQAFKINKSISITLNPVTEDQIRFSLSREEARKLTGLDSLKDPLLVYTGKLGIHYEKEIRLIIDAARLSNKFTLLITGGKENAVDKWRKYASESGNHKVIFIGYLNEYPRIIQYQFAADILVSYYTGQGHDVRYNLPNKLCEYMLSRNPIVSPNYPATCDLLNSENCFFTAPENAQALAETLDYILSHPDEAHEKARRAREAVEGISFKQVCAKVLLAFQHENGSKWT